MAAGKPAVEFDTARTRKQLERAEKRLYEYANGILVDQQGKLEDRIKALAPERTGDLKRHVYVDVVERPDGPVLKAGVKDLAYAVFVEFGTSDTPAQPFLRPALAEMPGYIKARRRRRR